MAFLGRVEVDQCAFWRLCGLESAEVGTKDTGEAWLHLPWSLPAGGLLSHRCAWLGPV